MSDPNSLPAQSGDQKCRFCNLRVAIGGYVTTHDEEACELSALREFRDEIARMKFEVARNDPTAAVVWIARARELQPPQEH